MAAYRLGFQRVATPYGDPLADERLARDVAGTVVVGPSSMVDYLAARTAFFDRVTVGALDRGCEQIVIAAAGYDGRAYRYAKPGVRWFELDHPDTQADKLERLERLQISTEHVAFVSADFGVDPVAARLTAAGLDPGAAAVVLVEGVAIYLERSVLDRLLRELRSIVTSSSRLAISLSINTGSLLSAARRSVFRSAVAAVGEPARTVLPEAEVEGFLAASGWERDPDGTGTGGLLLLTPLS